MSKSQQAKPGTSNETKPSTSIIAELLIFGYIRRNDKSSNKIIPSDLYKMCYLFYYQQYPVLFIMEQKNKSTIHSLHDNWKNPTIETQKFILNSAICETECTFCYIPQTATNKLFTNNTYVNINDCHSIFTLIDNYPCFILFDKNSNKEIQRVQSPQSITFEPNFYSALDLVYKTSPFRYLDDNHGIICATAANPQLYQFTFGDDKYAFKALSKYKWTMPKRCFRATFDAITTEYLKRDELVFMMYGQSSVIFDLNDDEWITPKQLTSFAGNRQPRNAVNRSGLCHDYMDRYKIYLVSREYSSADYGMISPLPAWYDYRYTVNYYDFSKDEWYYLPGMRAQKGYKLKHTWISEENSFLLHCMEFDNMGLYFQCYDLRSGNWETLKYNNADVQTMLANNMHLFC